MKKNLKIKMALFLSTIISSSLIYCSSAQAMLNNKSSDAILISTKKQEINNKPIVINKYLDNGKEIETYNGDSDVIEKYLQNKEPISRSNGSKIRTYSSSNVSSQSSKASVKETINYQVEEGVLKWILSVWGGSTIGTWKGNPKDLSGIVLHQYYTCSGLEVTGVWPSGGDLVHDETFGQWNSSMFKNCISANAPHNKVSIKRIVPLLHNFMSIQVDNSADFYFGNHCYKAQTSICKSFNDVIFK